MQTQTGIADLLQNVGEEIRELKSQVEEAIDAGDVAKAEEWIGMMNTLIRQLDHVVEKLETLEK